MPKKLWVTNAVILADDGKMVRYRPKCPACGYIPNNITCGGCVIDDHAVLHKTECQKCHSAIEIMIGRDDE